MSNEVNTRILEEAWEWSQIETDTILGENLLQACKTKDLEWARRLIKQARDKAFQQEFGRGMDWGDAVDVF